MIAHGDCDACGMTRALITDPAMPGRAAAGQTFTTCIGCNQGCIGHYHAGIPIACTINPWTGYESTLPRPTPDPSPGTVVVVGAGPGGASAAACAAARGHRVVVFERGEAVGGQMRLALNASGHAEIAQGMVRTVEAWLAGAEVRLGVEAGVDEVLAESPDRVIVATGAVHSRPASAATLTPGMCSRGLPRARAGRRLGRRLDGAGGGGAAGRSRLSRAAGDERDRVRRDDPPVPAEHVPGQAGRPASS
jgi:hypothetical protein